MKRKLSYLMITVLLVPSVMSCEILDDDIEKHVSDAVDSTYVGLDEVAALLSSIHLKSAQLNEVYSAVTSSSGNGYDEEYTMRNLFASPGLGVGDKDTRTVEAYQEPLRDLIERQVYAMTLSKSGGRTVDPGAFLDALTRSDIQIYWPFSEEWDGSEMPIITYDPEDGSAANIGYRLVYNDDGSRKVEEVTVDEGMAREQPVWVVNRNDDAGYTTLEMLRREDPAWGEGGGTIIVKPDAKAHAKSNDESFRTMILKDFTMNRNYDSWFAGASEFFVKTGYLDDFTASTEAELRLYNPMVTDFMIVVKRNQIGVPQPFNAVLMSDWSELMSECAFMITEDDGGTQTDWTAKAKVYISGKSYGVEISFPLNTRDDIVWRGCLSSRWFQANDNIVGHFGDVDLTFEIVENGLP